MRRRHATARAICRSVFESGETAKTLAFTNFASIVRIERKGDQAEVHFRADVPGEPKKTYATAALVTRRDGRWRVVLPCGVIGCDASLLPARQAHRPPAALRRQGRPPKGRKSDDNGPIGSDFYEDGGPSSWSPPGQSSVTPGDLNYRGRAYLVADGRGDPPVYGFIVTDRRAQTRRGVGIGDTLAFARRRYPQLRCDIVNQGAEFVTFPACRARLAPRRYLGAGCRVMRRAGVASQPMEARSSNATTWSGWIRASSARISATVAARDAGNDSTQKRSRVAACGTPVDVPPARCGGGEASAVGVRQRSHACKRVAADLGVWSRHVTPASNRTRSA